MIDKEIAEAERALYAAMIAQDHPALRETLSPQLVYIHSTGVAETRDEYLDGLSRGLYDYEMIESHDTRLRIDGDTAILDGVVDMKVGERGQPRNLLHLLFALIWVRDAGRWRLYCRQATRIP